MYSAGLTVQGNRSDGDRDHGLLLNYATGARIEGNAVVAGGEKCVFIYNSTKNTFAATGSRAARSASTSPRARNATRSRATPSSATATQVKYVGTGHQEWSAAGRGNYWSDNPAFDLDGDGVADQPYRPNDLIDQVVWTYPLAKLCSTARRCRRCASRRGSRPSAPGGVIDSAPLMAPPLVPAARTAAVPAG